MLGSWKQWEGQVVNGEFHLRQHLRGAHESAVFLTEYGQPQPHKAAIKLILAHATSPELQLSRWRRAAKFSHPHLIRLFQMGRCELDNTSLVFVVMEYAEEDLSQVFLERPLTPAETRAMLKPTLTALAFLHEKGFVHGRLKPANILSISDQKKVSSDGFRRIGESSVGLGTSSIYDPPEAARGQSSAAGDVWALGMVLVEALTQHPPIWEKTKHQEPKLPEGMPAPLPGHSASLLTSGPSGSMDCRRNRRAAGATLGRAPTRDDCRVNQRGREVATLHCPDVRGRADNGGNYCWLKAAPPSSGGSTGAFRSTGTSESSATTEAGPSDACNGAIHAEQQR